MSSCRIRLPDNSEKVFDHNPTALEVAQSIGARLAQDTIGVKVNGSTEIQDFRLPLNDGDKIELVTMKSPDAAEVIRHSAAHVMAQAVQELWPDVKVTIGPVIENGFYYDFDSPRGFTPEDLEKIEKQMQEIIKRDEPIVKEVWPADKAISTFKSMGERFKVEIIEDLKAKGEDISIYHQGKWFDLCRGPHVQKTGQVKAVKVMSLAGAYWRGDEKNPQLQRVYGTAFADKKDLEQYLHNLEEAKKRDHRRLGKDLGLFYFHPWAPASPFFTGRGSIVYNELQTYLRAKYRDYGYQEVITPQVYDVELYHTSGHYQNYRENMYFTKVDERDFSVKPMNCPGHCLLYGCEQYSYRDLPIRMADFGRLHRYEKSGVVHGLNRVRTFSQDDAHIFCRMDQLQEEISQFMKFLNEVYAKLGLNNYKVYLSTRPEKRMGADEVWDTAEGALSQALKNLNLPFTINAGDGAFYGPKLDIMFVDAIGRPWQLGTLQCDFNMPEAFALKYVGDDNKEHRPVMLHRAILGSFERFIGVYLEHTAGHLPTWLSPVQVELLTLTDKHLAYAEEVQKELKSRGVRVHLDARNEKLGFKIREAQMQKTPYMLVIGDKELETKTLTVRLKNGENKPAVPMQDFIEMIDKEVKERLLESPMGAKNVAPSGHV